MKSTTEVDAFGDPFDHSSFHYSEEGDRYPLTAWYVMRDQSARTSDDTVRVVIGDVADMLESIGSEEAPEARELASEADALFDFDAPNQFGCYWSVGDDGGEKLQDMLREAESFPHVYVEWDGDAGTVWVTLTDHWQVRAEQD